MATRQEVAALHKELDTAYGEAENATAKYAQKLWEAVGMLCTCGCDNSVALLSHKPSCKYYRTLKRWQMDDIML